jgi:hypothetical protein
MSFRQIKLCLQTFTLENINMPSVQIFEDLFDEGSVLED